MRRHAAHALAALAIFLIAAPAMARAPKRVPAKGKDLLATELIPGIP